MHTTDAQSVWKDFQEHIKSSYKGASEKTRLTQYVTNTVLDDNYKGIQQNNLYYISMSSSGNLKKSHKSLNIFHLRLNCNCMQNAVRPINDLRIVEDEFQSITTGYGRSSSLKYQTYYDLL